MFLDSLVYLVCDPADFSFFSFSPMLSVLLFTYWLEANDHVLSRSQVANADLENGHNKSQNFFL